MFAAYDFLVLVAPRMTVRVYGCAIILLRRQKALTLAIPASPSVFALKMQRVATTDNIRVAGVVRPDLITTRDFTDARVAATAVCVRC